MTTGPCLSRCESLTALPRASGSVKSGARSPSFRAFSAAPEVTSCLMGRSKSRSRSVGNQLAPSAINSSICCCNGVFIGISIAIVFLLPFLLLTHRLLVLPVLTEVRLLCRENRCLDSYQERGSRGRVCDSWLLKPKSWLSFAGDPGGRASGQILVACIQDCPRDRLRADRAL